MSDSEHRQTIAVDFDGVLHRYDTPWESPGVIADGPVDGAIEWLHRMVQRYEVVVFSTRCKVWAGRHAIRRWLRTYGGTLWDEGMDYRGLDQVRLASEKPPAILYIDDRAFCFRGTFPTAEEIAAFRPWNKQ